MTLKSSGNFNNLEKFLKKNSKVNIQTILADYGQRGVNALASATPIDSGLTAQGWSYEIEVQNGSSKLIWTNSHREGGAPIAILLQYGHGTRNGGYVVGRDYINPALRPILDGLVEGAWKEVIS